MNDREVAAYPAMPGADALWGAASPDDWEQVRVSGYRVWPVPESTEAISTRTLRTEADAVRWARTQIVPIFGSAVVAVLPPGSHVWEYARFQRELADVDFAPLPFAAPASWRRYLQQPSWFSGGWMASGQYLSLYTPRLARELTSVWLEPRDDLPHVFVIGSDGSAANLVLDLRDVDSPVYVLGNVCAGWHERIVQAPNMDAFAAQIENSTFEFFFG